VFVVTMEDPGWSPVCGIIVRTIPGKGHEGGHMVSLVRSILLFGLAGSAEIGGGWLVWQ
jgi:hypothetical protein